MQLKNKLRFWSILTFLTMLFIVGCSNDDSSSSADSSVTGGGDAYRYQAVTIDVQNLELNQFEYNATFGTNAIKVLKIDDTKLAFSIPVNADLGNVELLVPSLNITLNYNVLQSSLPQTPDETIAQLTTLGDVVIAGLPGVEPNNNYERFKDFYANNATAEQKEKMALCYYANKKAFDALISFDPENPSGRFSASDAAIIGKFLLAVGAGGASVWVMYSQIPADPAGAILAAGATYFFYKKAKNYGEQVANIADIQTTGLSIDGLLGMNGKGMDNVISLTNNVAVQLPFQLQGRALTQSDSNTANETVSSFFGKLEYMNDFMAKTNTAIEWINDNVPLVDFSTFDLIALQSSPETVSTNADTYDMQDITFSINHPNLQLVNTSLQENGLLNLQIKITGTPSETTIESTLNYSYNDGLNSFEGTFPISVSEEQQGPSVEIQFTLTCPQSNYSFPSNTVYNIVDLNYNESSCLEAYLTFIEENAELDEYNSYSSDIRFIQFGSNIFELLNSPTGTVFPFGGLTDSDGDGNTDPDSDFYNCENGNYININMKGPHGSTWAGSEVYFQNHFMGSYANQGSFTKTGENSFSFSGTVYNNGEMIPIQISGTGTFNP